MLSWLNVISYQKLSEMLTGKEKQDQKDLLCQQTLTQFTNFDTKQIGNACFHIALDADLVYVFQKVKLSLVLNIKQVYRYNYTII